MIVVSFSGGENLRGDLVLSVVLRYDLTPIPATVEVEVRSDSDVQYKLREGEIITVNGDDFRIIKSVFVSNRMSQGKHNYDAVRITGLLDACHGVAFIRRNAIIKENTGLASIYRASGAKIKAVSADFSVPRFACLIGDAPAFYISQVLQEEGGVVRWKDGKMSFFRLADLFDQEPVISIPNSDSENTESGFLERHKIPWFFTTNNDGSIQLGNRLKQRAVKYSPFKSRLQLNNMSKCLIHKKTAKLMLSPIISAGDLIDVYGINPLVVVTVAHVFESGTDGSPSNQYSKLWLSEIG